jgi:type II secretory pathway component PulJ
MIGPRRPWASRRRPARPRRGFGVLEVLISASLLVIGLASVVSFSAQSSAVAAHQRQVTIGAHVAEMQMERLLLLFPDDARLSSGAHTGPRFDGIGNPSASGAFATSWVVATGSPIQGARTITLTVTWTEGGAPRTVTLRTIRT